MWLHDFALFRTIDVQSLFSSYVSSVPLRVQIKIASRQKSPRRIVACFLRFMIISVFHPSCCCYFSRKRQDPLPKQKVLAHPKVHLRAASRQCPRSPRRSARPQLWRTNRSRARPRPRPRPRFKVRATLSELPRFFFKGPKVNSGFGFEDEI